MFFRNSKEHFAKKVLKKKVSFYDF